jgi:hypothetical protein
VRAAQKQSSGNFIGDNKGHLIPDSVLVFVKIDNGSSRHLIHHSLVWVEASDNLIAERNTSWTRQNVGSIDALSHAIDGDPKVNNSSSNWIAEEGFHDTIGCSYLYWTNSSVWVGSVVDHGQT